MVAGGVSCDNYTCVGFPESMQQVPAAKRRVLMCLPSAKAPVSPGENWLQYTPSDQSEVVIWPLRLTRLEDELERRRIQTLTADQLTCQAVQHGAVLVENGHCSRVSFPQ